MGKELLTATLRASARCDASTFGRAEALAARDDFLTGDTAWDHPGEDVWRECAAPDLPGRKVYSWAGPAAASG